MSKKKTQAPKTKKQSPKAHSTRVQKPEKGKSSPIEKKQVVCLCGDEQIVKEYSAVFQEHGVTVLELKNISSLASSAKKITLAFELSLGSGDTKKRNLTALDTHLPPAVPVVLSSLAETVLMQTHNLDTKDRFVGIAAFPTLIGNHLVELCPSLYTKSEILESVKKFFESIKKETAVVQDGVGMVMPRILCQIINEAFFVVNHDIAQPKDIDIAMKFGTNYPRGPIEWGEHIGFKNIVTVLDALYQNNAEERYRVAPLLRQLAVAGTFWGNK